MWQNNRNANKLDSYFWGNKTENAVLSKKNSKNFGEIEKREPYKARYTGLKKNGQPKIL